MYQSWAQTPDPINFASVVVRSDLPAGTLAASLRAAIARVDPDLPLADVRPLEALVGESVAQARFHTALLVAFAGLAVLLTVIGVYGVMSYLMNQRTREVGIRMALGASPRSIATLVLGQGVVWVAGGLLLGLGGALALVRLLASLLFGVSAFDPPVFAAAAVVLAAAALAALYVPARRAAHIAPLDALRDE